MKKIIFAVMLGMLASIFAACSDDSEEVSEDDVKKLEVEFNLPDEADVNEPVELEAVVTYGDEKVTDAEEMQFEYWEKGDKDNSEYIQGQNNDDGTYTAEVTFDHDGTYELYAHTSAKDLHTMPKKEIDIGDVSASDDNGENES